MSLLHSSYCVQTLQKRGVSTLCLLATAGLVLSGCADAMGPDSRNANIPAPKAAEQRKTAVNEGGEPVIYLPLGEDVLMPQSSKSDPLPDTIVGPFELRGETLAGALQLIMDGVDIPVAFESTTSLTQPITVTNLKGPISQVVNDVCSLANMYCSYQGGILSVKDREIFSVTIPPIVAKTDVAVLLTNISSAIGSITGESPITDPSTRTIVYRASQRTAEMATRYFQRLRSNTAMIVYETYIWEVALDSGNAAGIKWSFFENADKFEFGINLPGIVDTNVGGPISIGLPTTGAVNFTSGDVLQFISSYGAVKTISQPQISVLSGSNAKLRVADKQNYLASISRTTTDGGTSTISTTTGSVDTGFTLNIGSNWDNSTIYGTIDILLQEVQKIDTFDENPDAIVQLPQTTERELSTTVRVRPGDMVLIAGLVRESDKIAKEGPGFAEPLFPTSRSAQTANTELVFLLRPRVIVFTAPSNGTPRKGSVPLPDASFTQPIQSSQSDDIPAPVAAPVSSPVVPFAVAKPTEPEVVVSEPAAASIEIQSLSSVVDDKNVATDKVRQVADPSVIVNYDILGR